VLDGTAWERDDVDPDLWCYADTILNGTDDLGTPGQPNGLCGAVVDTAVDTDLPVAPGLGAGDLLITEFMANPAWWLRDDAGRVINVTQGASSVPRIDYTVAAARDWWASVPLAGAGAAALIDGVLADGTGSRCPAPGISAARCARGESSQEPSPGAGEGSGAGSRNSGIDHGRNR
jgi:hypothetical protein